MSNQRLPMTPRQQQIFDFIDSVTTEQGYPMTVRDIANRFKFASPNGAICHLKALRKKGWVTWEPGKARTVRVMQCQEQTAK